MKSNLKWQILLLLSLVPVMGFSQRNMLNSKIWHIDGSAGLTFKGYMAEVAIGKHNAFDTRQWGRVALEYLATEIPGKDIENFNRDINFPVKAYSLNVTYNHTLIGIPRYHQVYNMHAYVSLDVGGGGVLGYETINNSRYKLETGETLLDRSKMIYGGVIRADLEMYFDVPNLTVFVAAQQKYLISSDIGKGRFAINFGIRYWL